MFPFYTPRKHLKPKGFMIFLGGKEKNINLSGLQEHLQLSYSIFVHYYFFISTLVRDALAKSLIRDAFAKMHSSKLYNSNK